MEMMNPDAIVEQLNRELDDMKKRGFTVVGNVQHLSRIPPLHVPTLEIVDVDPSPKNGDVYEQKGGKLSMTAQCIRKFSNALNIIWRGGEVLTGSTDNCIRFRAKASRKGVDGSWQHVEKDKEIDLDAVRDEIQLKNEGRASYYTSGKCPRDKMPKDWRCQTDSDINDWIEHQTKVELIEKRKHKLANAQTGAQTRCVREIGQLKNTYTADELQTPFVVLKLIFQPDPNHPIDRNFMLQNSVGAVASLYPPAPEVVPPSLMAQAPSLLPPVDPEAPPALTSLEFTGNDAGDIEPFIEPENVEVKKAGVEVLSERTPEDQKLHEALDFEVSDQKQQCEVLAKLIKAKAYQGNLNRPLAKFTDGERKEFFVFLSELEDPEAEPANPWT